ncbi:MAG TPA: tetratricopeptide repeat protein, partial [Cellvibrionaceae bacterium]
AAPNNQDAQAAAILALIESDRLLEALEATRQAKTRDNGSLLQSIAANAREATDAQRAVLLDQFQQLLAEDPDNMSVLVGTALLLQQQQLPEQALPLAQRAIELRPNHIPAIILASGLLHQLEQNDEALALVRGKLQAQADDNRLRLQLARLLVFSDLQQAQQQFQQLVDNNPQDADLLLALAMVAQERDDQTVAESSYQSLLALGAHESTAHFYLGQRALNTDNSENALEHFTQVAPGPEFINATSAIFNIHIEAGNLASADTYFQQLMQQLPDHQEQLILLYSHNLASYHHYAEALQVLNLGLTMFEHNSGMLYSRSLMHERLGDIDSAEADLRLLLLYDPNNATALNALGYILADKTDRYEEAYGYIERALEQQPDDPATIDSMGWVHFKLGNYNQALLYLRRAMDLYPDHEIAAHLGEVLWITGEREQARNVWRTGLELKADSHHILETMKRLGIDDLE